MFSSVCLSSSTRLRLSQDPVVVGLYSLSNALILGSHEPNLDQGRHTQPQHSDQVPSGDCLSTGTTSKTQCLHPTTLSLKSRHDERLRQRALTVRRARRKRTCESTICFCCTIFLIADVKKEIRSESSLQYGHPFLSLYH